MREAVPIVLHHHERFDGTGYPHGLRGEEIPLGARIVAVADAYHAMVHDRPYKSALTHDQALAELRRHASTQFDPTVVEVFIAIFGEKVPSDGLEEIRRLHQHAEGGLEAVDPRAAALLHALQPLDAPAVSTPAPRKSRASGSRVRPAVSAPTGESAGDPTRRPVEQTG
jgi:hypothetical protein